MLTLRLEVVAQWLEDDFPVLVGLVAVLQGLDDHLAPKVRQSQFEGHALLPLVSGPGARKIVEEALDGGSGVRVLPRLAGIHLRQ